MFISTGISLLGAQPSGGGGLWTPADITTYGWYDASDASTITLSGTDVTAWDDKSGNGFTATQTGSDNPTYATALVNGLNSVEFGNDDGTSARGFGFLDTANLGLGLVASSYAFFASYARYAGLTINHLIGGGVGSTNKNLHCGYDNNTQLRIAQFGNDTSVLVPGYTTTQDAIVTGLNDSGIDKIIRDNGGLYETIRANSNDLSDNQGFAIGRFINNSFLFKGRINEMVFLNSFPSTSDRDKIEGYLAWKWGTEASLPVTHPYKYTPPTT